MRNKKIEKLPCKGQCRDDKKICDVENGGGYTCTLNPKHKGKHIACGTVVHSLVSWE